jgi:hypothetical protein
MAAGSSLRRVHEAVEAFTSKVQVKGSRSKWDWSVTAICQTPGRDRDAAPSSLATGILILTLKSANKSCRILRVR